MSMYKYEAKEVEVTANQHGWHGILDALGSSALRNALPVQGKTPVHSPCPQHNSPDGFRLFNDYNLTGGGTCSTCGAKAGGISLLMWDQGWAYPEALEAIAVYLGIGENGTAKSAPSIRQRDPKELQEEEARRQQQVEDNDKLRSRLRKIWREAVPLDSPSAEPARLYLARRGLRLDCFPDVLRFHPGLAYSREGVYMGDLPCMVALASNANGKSVTIHRTYLDAMGNKADIPDPKKLHPYPSDRTLSGGGIRLWPVSRLIGFAEGVETALAAYEGTGIPTWAGISDQLMANIIAPKGVEMAVIFGDRDASEAGRKATSTLVERLWSEGIQVVGLLPPKALYHGQKSLDWLDVYASMGADGFQLPDSVRQMLNQAAA